MNRKLLAATIALVIVIGGSVGAVALTQGAGDATESAPTGANATAALPIAATATSGAYVEYTPSAIADAKGETVLFFHAPWCPTCRKIEADILSSGVPAGVTVIKVDYDTHQDLRQKYGVTVQTTFVKVDSAGVEEKSVTPSNDLRVAAIVDALN